MSLALLPLLRAAAQVPDNVQPGDFAESKYAVLQELATDRSKVHQGEEFHLTLRLTPYKSDSFEFHLYGIQQTGNMDYMASVFKMDDAPGIGWTVDFPAGEESQDSGGKTYTLHGQQVVLITGKVAPDAQPGERELTGKFLFNTCTDDMCLPPSQLDLKWTVEVVPSSYMEHIDVVGLSTLTATTEVAPESWKLPMTEPAAADGEGVEQSLAQLEPQGGAQGLSLWTALLFAFLGGLILNIMPCVLPVVSIKVISLARHAQEHPGTVVKQGLVFCLGIIATFLALALVVNIVQAGGTKLGWGFQFQDWRFLLVMSTVIFAFGLSLAGVYTIKPPRIVTEEAEHLSEREGYAGSFFKGVLATVLGTPCVGPFLGPALGFAFTRSPWEVWAIFGLVGIGMAVPYALLVANPRFLKMGQRERGKLTRSIMDAKGWLTDFERVMAFVLFATVIYLLSILAGGLGAHAVIWSLAFLLGIAFALWLWGRLINGGRSGIIAGLLLGPAIIAASALLCLPRVHPPPASAEGNMLAWEPYDEAKLADYLDDGKTVMVDFTADWCPNCKTNEAVALNVIETKKLLGDLGVVAMQADWTNQDKAIGSMLRRLGRASIPLTAVFPAKDRTHPYVLDGLYTAGKLHPVVKRAVEE